MSNDRVIVGSFAGAFGVRGETRIKSFCADPAAIADYTPLYTEDGRSFTTVVLTGQAKGALIARVDGIVTKEDADALKGVNLFADRSHLPNLPDDEYYHADLIGLEVVDTGGTVLGHVKSVQNHGAADLLEIHGPGLKTTVLLPFTLAAVPTVDLAAGRIIADPPDGLF
ncbi:16S rRNA processing protein RimM [Loktanella sp. IMCC34160]|uniref:ribosome maturation factor RimM n=1 Tax=Loktanella sp. IMCC34160 TaxID=2510646 RepID=UPI00101D5576|nr:ribosome maturation factor RimM [Loktanella sp. IMCC34160]RYG90563.1 16S rRNA processing protein RimM [Loktanella sp. IMCC34160]